MNSFAISANSAWNTLNVISDRAWYLVDLTYCPKAIAIYRKIILGAITVAAFVYALGYASRDVWRWVVAKCDRYLEQCENGGTQDEILETVEAIGDAAVTYGAIVVRVVKAIVAKIFEALIIAFKPATATMSGRKWVDVKSTIGQTFTKQVF